MTSEFSTRFSDEELNKCQNWSLPDVSNSRLIPSAEKEARERQQKQQQEAKNKSEKQTQPVNEKAGEKIESVEQTLNPITAEQLQKITQDAEKEGYQAGYDKGTEEGRQHGNDAGYAEGLLKAQEAVKDQCERLQHIADALMIPLQNEQKQLERLMLDMVCMMAKAVVHRELQMDSSHIIKLVESALSAIPPSTEKFALYLNGDDVDIIQQHLGTIDKQITYHIDDQLLPGGCRLETKQTVVDYSVEQRLKTVIEGFLHQQFTSADSDAKPLNNADSSEVGDE
jgi:flagellar assembly protein FliH